MTNKREFEKIENSIETIERLGAVTEQCLQRALSIHDQLGESGEEMVQKNQFGDTALRADIECEIAILKHLKEANIPIRVISEEHGQVDIMERPRYLGILDGLDGSSIYKKERSKGRYGTMFGIYDNLDPFYRDYLISGIMEHSSKRLYFAVKGGGAFIVQGDTKTPIRSSRKTRLDNDSRIYIDESFDINREVFSSKLKNHIPVARNFSAGSSAVHYADVAAGEADLALECTRKNNLEIAIAFGLEAESGAVMTDLNGESLNDKKYFEFGQKEHMPVITAATNKLALDLIEHLKRTD